MRLKSIKQNKWWLAICVGLVFLLTISVYNIQTAKAGSLTVISDVMSRLKASEDADHTITFTIASAVDAGETIAITFPSDFDTTSVDFSDIDVTDDGADLTLAAAASGTTWGVAFGGTGSRTLTLTSDTGTMVAGSVVVFEIGTNAASGDQAINNATTAGNYVVSIAGTLGDTGQYAVYIVDNDQVGVTAAVDPTLSFSISDLAIGFGHFGSTAIRYATSDEAGDTSEPAVANPTKFTVSTNGDNGLTITVRDEGNGSNAGLWAAAPVSELIPAAASSDVSIGGKEYGAYGKNASSLTIDEAFDNDTNADVAISRTAQTFATAAAPVSDAYVDLALLAAIDGTTKAGNYTDTITVICTGNF